MREINVNEVQKLAGCLQSLAEYHNEVSTHFKGCYPSRPYQATLKMFEEALTNKTSRIAVAENQDGIIGFCKIDICGEKGKLDYLVVRKEYRGNGYGKSLMDWAMKSFDQCRVRQIEVKVVDGNESIRFYEKYGFAVNAQILVKNRSV